MWLRKINHCSFKWIVFKQLTFQKKNGKKYEKQNKDFKIITKKIEDDWHFHIVQNNCFAIFSRKKNNTFFYN